MLVLAAAAATKHRTGRIHPPEGRSQHRHEIGFGKILMVAKHPRPHPFARQGKRHHHHPFRFRLTRQEHPPQAGPEIGERADLQFDLLVIREGLVVEFFLFAHGTHRTQ